MRESRLAMVTPQPIVEAGLAFEYQDEGTRLIVRDAKPDSCAIRNRGGEALANVLKANRQISALDIGQSGISDSGVGYICMALRQTNQLEEFIVGTVGIAGLEFLLGVVRRCGRLRSLSISVVDMTTLVAASQNVKAEDYNTAAYVKQRKEGDEEEEEAEEPPPGGDDEEEEPEVRERKRLEKLRAILNQSDYDSEDEDSANQKRQQAGEKLGRSPSARFLQLVEDFAVAVRDKENLLNVTCSGDSVPKEVMHDIAESVKTHNAERQRRLAAKQERGAKTALDALKGQMEELRAPLEGGAASAAAALRLPGEEGEGNTRLGVRSFIGRRLFSAMGEALFECQRYKSKENEAVATWQGECAFLAMYLRKLAKEEKSENERLRREAK